MPRPQVLGGRTDFQAVRLRQRSRAGRQGSNRANYGMIRPEDNEVAPGSPDEDYAGRWESRTDMAASGHEIPGRSDVGALGLPYGFRDLHIQVRRLEERGTARRRRTGPCARDVGGVHIPLFQWCLMHPPLVGKRGQPLQ
jgi:hypothetical protein